MWCCCSGRNLPHIGTLMSAQVFAPLLSRMSARTAVIHTHTASRASAILVNLRHMNRPGVPSRVVAGVQGDNLHPSIAWYKCAAEGLLPAVIDASELFLIVDD